MGGEPVLVLVVLPGALGGWSVPHV